jgi:hypothetical protein
MIDSSQVVDVTINNHQEEPVLDYIKLKNNSLPKNLRIGDWLLVLDQLFSVYRCIFKPEERGGISDYDIYYLVWPLSDFGSGEEK